MVKSAQPGLLPKQKACQPPPSKKRANPSQAKSVPTQTKQKACQHTQGEKRNANENDSHLERRGRADLWYHKSDSGVNPFFAFIL